MNKSELYERIETLCKEKGVSVTKMCAECGTGTKALRDLANDRIQSLPSSTVQKIATYFGVSTDIILGNNVHQCNNTVVKRYANYFPSRIFNIVKTTDKQVIVKVFADDNWIIANNPFVSADFDYITVTRGKDHIITIVYKNGNTFSFEYGESGCTAVSKTIEWLRKELFNFLDLNGILLELTTTDIKSARIFYNENHQKWQLQVNDCVNYFSDTAKSFDEMKNCAARFVKVTNWAQHTTATGMTVWDAEGPIGMSDAYRFNP